MAISKRKGLGRGIGALIGDDRPAIDPVSRETGDETRRQIPLAYIKPGEAQPRRHFDEGALDELAQSIKEKGLIQPLIVRKVGPDAFELVAGERRWRAAQKVGLHHVPVVVQDYDDTVAAEIAMIENVQREDLTPAEEARGYKALMDKFGHRQEDLARIVGKSRSHIANLLRLLGLPDPVLHLLDLGKLTMGHARALVGRDDAEAVAARIVKDGLTVRAVETLFQNPAKGKKTAKTKRVRAGRKDADTRAIEQAIAAAIGMKTSIDHGADGGTITLNYKDVEDIDGLLSALKISL